VLPSDAPLVEVAGRDSYRVLVVGSGPAAGIGVASHDRALTGALARQLLERSGRGAVVEALGVANFHLSDVPALLAASSLDRFDAVVVTAGMMEAVDMASNRTWERWVLAIMEMVQDRCGPRVPVVLSGMPAPSRALLADVGRRGWFIDRRASQLNGTSRRIVGAHEHWHFAQLRSSAHSAGQPTADTYAAWADDIGSVLAPALTRHAPNRISDASTH
jgi:hypothetical protein